MREALALVRVSGLTALSYRMELVFSVLGLVLGLLPVYFVAEALQPTMGPVIRAEGTDYFTYVVIGMVSFSFLSTAVLGLPSEIGGAIRSGTLEAMLATPARAPALLAGMAGFGLLWTAFRAALMLAAAMLLGAHVRWAGAATALVALVLLVVAYLAIGLAGAALQLAFRTTGPLAATVLTLSGLLGGVYFPTHVIPSWIQSVSAWIPLTHALRALRLSLLEGAPLRACMADLAFLALLASGLLLCGVVAFGMALAYARRAGTLGQY